jgi:hypothetical protein
MIALLAGRLVLTLRIEGRARLGILDHHLPQARVNNARKGQDVLLEFGHARSQRRVDPENLPGIAERSPAGGPIDRDRIR